MNQSTPLCIYHHGCADGVAAAWAVLKHYRECDQKIDLRPGIYGEAPPDVTGRDVILVDFSYKRPVLLAMAEQARSVLILDHHKTAQEELTNLPASIDCVFDMNRSGAMIAWECYHPDRRAPPLFDYIQDRDLWRFKLVGTREITAAIYSYPLDPETFGDIIFCGEGRLLNEGRSLVRKQDADVAALIKATTRRAWFGTVEVPIANVPYMFASDVGHELSKGEPFSATYYDDADGRRFSLRSSPEGANVAKIAEAFGGGGHKHAAGFRMTREEAIDFELASATQKEEL